MRPTPSHLRAEVEARLTNALLRLASARRETLSKEDFGVFADGLREFPVDLVQRICEELGRIAPDEFQPRFPPLHIIRELCFKAQDRERERRHERLIGAPVPDPIAPEKWEEIRQKFHAVLDRKKFGG